jgi:transposase
MSLIHTAELNDVAPFEYLVALQRNPVALADESRGLDAVELSAALAAQNSGPDPPA